ncbi:hypothetical protein [Maridesulfovibrio zosterae]|uniref:hypothetical protein n=1 Tax=Maridesulfovibrio zosterae TaxID=82171 RepID=UPI0004026112|nr:hypothetical protein [Maridesulfovibrio zosterae]
MKFKKKYSHLAVFILIFCVLVTSGCASINPFADEIPEYDLDGKHEMNLILMPEDTVVFEMRNPGSGGYGFDGITFDPKLIKLEKYSIIPPESGLLGDFGRWRFELNMIGLGETSVIINIKRPNEEQRDAYKIVNINITKEGEPFIVW